MMTLDPDRGKGDASHVAGDEEETRRAGRGVILTMSAKAVFIVSGFATQVILQAVLGAAAWGRYSTVATIVSIVTNTLVAATVQTVSKRASESDRAAPGAQREGLLIGAAIATLLGGGFALGSPLLASEWQRDPSMAPLFVTAAILIAAYALYAAQIGAINGRREFSRQAGFDIVFALMRSGALIGGAAIGAAAGALAGWAGASLAVVIGAAIVAGTGARGRIEARSWLAFFVPIALYHAALNGILQGDQPLLRGHVVAMAIESGITRTEANELASTIAGQYRAAQVFAFVPYQMILAVTFVVFPTIARSTASGDLEATRRAISAAMRFSLIVVLAIAAPIAGASDGVIRISSEEMLGGAPALSVLSIGLVPFALFAIAAAILAGSGRTLRVATIAAIAVALSFVLNAVLVRGAGPGPEAAIAAATATSAAAIVALVVAGWTIHALFGAFLAPLSLLRSLIAAAAGAAVAHAVPHASRSGALLALIAGGLAYLAALAIVRELGAEDLALARRVLRR